VLLVWFNQKGRFIALFDF